MAATVLSGNSNPTYTNSTGQNVRVIINFMASPTAITWAGISATATQVLAIGRNLAFSAGFYQQVSGTSPVAGALSACNMAVNDQAVNSETANRALPTELMLANGQSFSANCGQYNIVIIPEAG